MSKLHKIDNFNRFKELRNGLILMLISILLTICICEIYLRIIDYPMKEPKCYYLVSKPSLKSQETSFAYHDNSKVRQLSVCEGGGGLNIIFDITFQTNNLGLVQRSNIISQKQSIVIIGDSFTQGEGAVPWFYDLEKKWQSNEYQLVNLGITGTGILQWYDTLQWFSKIAKIKHIYFLFISADWERPRWYAREDLGSKGLFLWDDSRGDFEFWKNKIPPDMIFIGKDSDQETILSNLHNIVSDSTILRAKNYLRNSYLVRMVYGLRNKIKNDKIFDQNKACFEKIITRYGAQNITFFHIPVGKEVSQGVYDATGRQVRDLILTRNIAYIDGLALCGLTGEDFLPLDGHPNESGYSKILKCLLRSLP